MTENTTGFNPAGAYILVLADPVKEKTTGGLYLPDNVADAQKFETEAGEIIAVGPSAFVDSGNFADGECYGAGRRVMFTKFSGRVVQTNDGKRWLAMKDDAVVGVYDE